MRGSNVSEFLSFTFLLPVPFSSKLFPVGQSRKDLDLTHESQMNLGVR